jgi:hypothetical protein
MAVLVALGLLQGEQVHPEAVKMTEKGNPIPDTYTVTRKAGTNTVTFRIEERDEAGVIANYLEFFATGELADRVESLQWKAVKVKAALSVKRSKDAAPVHKYEVLDIVEAGK